MPITSCPCSFSRAAATEESTPPLMATTTLIPGTSPYQTPLPHSFSTPSFRDSLYVNSVSDIAGPRMRGLQALETLDEFFPSQRAVPGAVPLGPLGGALWNEGVWIKLWISLEAAGAGPGTQEGGELGRLILDRG